MKWREYHELTKDSPESLRRAPQLLDWANTFDSFRHREGVPVLDLPADPPALSICDGKDQAERIDAAFRTLLAVPDSAVRKDTAKRKRATAKKKP